MEKKSFLNLSSALYSMQDKPPETSWRWEKVNHKESAVLLLTNSPTCRQFHPDVAALRDSLKI